MASNADRTDMYKDGGHISIMASEMVSYLNPVDGGVYVDGTFGAGGHTRCLLEAANCHVYAIDCDPYVEIFVEKLKQEFGDRITFIQGKFGDMEELLEEYGVKHVDGIFLDIGVSSMQVDTAERGFSFMYDGPLDMRMGNDGANVADFINSAEEEEIANIIYKYGDERKSRRIAKAIIFNRDDEPITRTKQLADIVAKAVGRGKKDTINPATRTFQALRIFINDELGELEKALESSERILSAGGRIAIITFHSGEDRIVKEYFNSKSGKNTGYSRHYPVPEKEAIEPVFRLVTKKAISPSEDEVSINSRSRSAKLRVAEKTNSTSSGGGMLQ